MAFDGPVTDVYSDGDQWVAGGWDPENGPVAWTSADAVNWVPSVVENQQPDETFAGPRLGPIIRVGDSLLSFGTFIGCCDGRGVYGWRSGDGAVWEAIESSSPLFADGYFVQETAAGAPGLVAVEAQFAVYSGRFWTWTEATSWVETTPGAGSGTSSGIQVDDIIWSQDRFVAVGARGNSGDQFMPKGTSWTSTDGHSWSESAPDPALDGIHLSSVGRLPNGNLVALGFPESPEQGDAPAIALTSPDGLAWTESTVPFGGSLELVEVPGGLAALGGETVWTTSDGIQWTETGSPSDPVVAAAVMGTEIVVFTADYEAGTWAIQRGVIGS